MIKGRNTGGIQNGELSQKNGALLPEKQEQGIPNLMMYIGIANVAVYLLSIIDPSNVVYALLRFSPAAILKGQVWRLVTYILTYMSMYRPARSRGRCSGSSACSATISSGASLRAIGAASVSICTI